MQNKYYIQQYGIYEYPKADEPAPDTNQVAAAEKVIEAMKANLKGLEVGKNTNSRYSSYSYKHLFEKSTLYENKIPYCSNGSAIQALVNQGFKIGKVSPPNCGFNLSKKGIQFLKSTIIKFY
ncbi:hypothetical protein [Labilibaculum manganireducens]|uniref:hypothetical protein n=1 Tax=Labilibaculum manganireducens TaxID=1940525 RepID=UPI0029F4BC86|nr:hypothetical protein [Labilibaculum manganireducens]